MKRQILSIALILSLCVSFIPVAHAEETFLSPQQVYQTLIALKEQDNYKEGTPWDNDNHKNYHWNGGPVAGNVTVGDGCAAFAFELSDLAFGNLPARTYITGSFQISDVRPGDILRVEGNSHSVIVLQVTESGAIIAEANYHVNGGPGLVHWGRSISKEYVENSSYFITRYPEGYIPPDDPEAGVELASGTAGDLSWSLTKSGMLTISGSGPIPDYAQPEDVPWYTYSDKILRVQIGENVTSVGQNAFYKLNDGYALLSVDIPDSVEAIGINAFRNSALISVSIPNSVKTVGDSAFHECANLVSVSFGDGIETIGQTAFQACTSLNSVTLPASVRSIGAGAFWQCGELREAFFQPGSPDLAVTMGDNMFTQCYNLRNVTLPIKIDRISDGMFQNCLYLSTLSIPQGAESIGNQAFASCGMLISVHIPDSVSTIRSAAFSQTPLKDIYFSGTESQWNEIQKIGDTATVLQGVTIHYGTQPPVPDEHTHVWSNEWSNNGTHHWHACTADGCPITTDSDKDGYDAHTYGGWTVTQAATSSSAGSRYRDCTICGYRETKAIPATGRPSGGSGSGSGSGWSDTTTTTTRNPDGSTTTTSTNNRTGTVTVTTTDPDGNKTQTITQKDGSSAATVTRKDGTTATINTSAAGKVEAMVKLPASVVSEAQENGNAVSLPIPAVDTAQDAPSSAAVTVSLESSTPVKVEIPAASPACGTVAVLVKADGTEEFIKTSVPTKSGIIAELSNGATVKLVDNSKSFKDVPDGNWAAEAASFASARELIVGVGDDMFSPDKAMTRAMLMTVLARFDGHDVSGGDTWYQKGVDWAVAKGVSDGRNPNMDISREQLAVMLWRYAGSPAASSSLDGFSDAGEVSGYARDALGWAVDCGVISGYGDGRLGPKGQATRAQAAQMLMNFIEKSFGSM